MLRPQEYYENESTEFRGQSFTHKEFRKWYSKKMGKFSYTSDWGGFNLPGWVLKMLRHGTMNPLTLREKALLAAVPDSSEEFYVIAANTDDHDLLMHEISHAMFYLSKSYKEQTLKILRKYNTKDISAMLRELGYWNAVIEDETIAYLLFTRSYMEKKHGINVSKYGLLVKQLTAIFNDEYKKSTKNNGRHAL